MSETGVRRSQSGLRNDRHRVKLRRSPKHSVIDEVILGRVPEGHDELVDVAQFVASLRTTFANEVPIAQAQAPRRVIAEHRARARSHSGRLAGVFLGIAGLSLGGMATAGALPDDVQRSVAHVADRIGLGFVPEPAATDEPNDADTSSDDLDPATNAPEGDVGTGGHGESSPGATTDHDGDDSLDDGGNRGPGSDGGDDDGRGTGADDDPEVDDPDVDDADDAGRGEGSSDADEDPGDAEDPGDDEPSDPGDPDDDDRSGSGGSSGSDSGASGSADDDPSGGDDPDS